LFPGIVTVVDGVIVRFPVLSVPAQNTPFRLALLRGRVLLAGPPVVEFQTTWTFRTVIESCGFVMDRLIVLASKMMEPVEILLQPGTAVEVTVGVKVRVGVTVSVGVSVTVAVRVNVGTSEGVLLGKGVIVTTSPIRVAVGVCEETVAVAVAVGVREGITVPGVVGTPGVVGMGVLVLKVSRS
jgi:hypothetical protein